MSYRESSGPSIDEMRRQIDSLQETIRSQNRKLESKYRDNAGWFIAAITGVAAVAAVLGMVGAYSERDKTNFALVQYVTRHKARNLAPSLYDFPFSAVEKWSDKYVPEGQDLFYSCYPSDAVTPWYNCTASTSESGDNQFGLHCNSEICYQGKE